MTRSALPALLASAALLLSACGGASSEPTAEAAEPTEVESDTRLADAYEACLNGTVTRDESLTLADEGQTLLVDTNPTDFEYDVRMGGLNCVLDELKTSTAITSSIERTTAMMGVQEKTDDGLNYSWTYHPDSGAELIVASE